MFVSEKNFRTLVEFSPLIAVDLVIVCKNNRVLLGRRKNEPARNTLFVPGGRIRKNEPIDDAINRILIEETGYTLSGSKDKQLLGVFEHFYKESDFGNAISTHYVTLGYKICVQEEFEPKPDAQHGFFKWISSSESLEDDDIHQYTKAYLDILD